MLPLIVPLSFSSYANALGFFSRFIGTPQEDVLNNGLVRDGVALG